MNKENFFKKTNMKKNKAEILELKNKMNEMKNLVGTSTM